MSLAEQLLELVEQAIAELLSQPITPEEWTALRRDAIQRMLDATSGELVKACQSGDAASAVRLVRVKAAYAVCLLRLSFAPTVIRIDGRRLVDVAGKRRGRIGKI